MQPIGYSASRVAIAVMLSTALFGCASSRDYDRALQGCVRCSLPEHIEPGHALIYVIRGPHLVNQYDENNLYIAHGEQRQFSGATIDNTYCPLNVPPGAVTLVVETIPMAEGPLNRAKGSTLTFEVSAEQEYFVLLDFRVGLIASSSTLENIDEVTGRKLLANIQGKCFSRPYSERRAEQPAK